MADGSLPNAAKGILFSVNGILLNVNLCFACQNVLEPKIIDKYTSAW